MLRGEGRGLWGGGGGGGIAGQCCPLRYRALWGGIAALLSQIAVEWVTKQGACTFRKRQFVHNIFVHNFRAT